MTDDEMLAALRGPIDPLAPTVAPDLAAACQLARVYALGIDQRDQGLVRSVFAPDAVVDGMAGTSPIDDYLPVLFEGVARYAATMHNITNQYGVIDGDAGAVWSYGHCLHIEPDGSDRPDLHVGVQYRDKVRRDRGRWVIAARRTVPIWTRGPLNL
jgi:SnoaL-like protein